MSRGKKTARGRGKGQRPSHPEDVLDEGMFEESELLERDRLSLSSGVSTMFDSSDDDQQASAQLERGLTLRRKYDIDEVDASDDSSEVEKYQKKKKGTAAGKSKGKRQVSVISSSSEGDDEEGSDDSNSEIDTSVWGTKRADYYGADKYSAAVSSSDDDGESQALREEEEAKRLRKKHAEALDEADFYEAAPQPRRRVAAAKSASSDSEEESDDNLSEDERSKKKFIVQKEVAGLSKEQKAAIVQQESPELLQLLEEFSSNLQVAAATIQPLLARALNSDPAERIVTDQGLSYLETKFHLLLNYCTNISFYLLLKVSGAPLKDHPVIDQLVRMRLLLEKIKPLDQKLKYQVDKLIRLATLGPQITENLNDPLSFKPRLDDVEDEGNDSEEAVGGRRQAQQDDEDNDKEEIYRPPRISMNKFESSSDKKKKREGKQAEKLARNRMMKFIRDEYGDAPEIMDADGGALSKASHEDSGSSEEERTKFEEEYMVRLPQTREFKKKQAAKQRRQGILTHDLRDLEDFGDVAGLADPSKRTKPLGHFLNEIETSSARSNARAISGDADLPIKPPKGRFDGNKGGSSRSFNKGRDSKSSGKRDSRTFNKGGDSRSKSPGGGGGGQQKRFRTR